MLIVHTQESNKGGKKEKRTHLKEQKNTPVLT